MTSNSSVSESLSAVRDALQALMSAFAELEKKLAPPSCAARIPKYKNNVVTQTQCNNPVAEDSDCCDSCTKRRNDHYELWMNGECRVAKLAEVGKIGWHGIRGGPFPWYSRMVSDDGIKRNRNELSEPQIYIA